MSNDIIEKYKREMMRMYSSQRARPIEESVIQSAPEQAKQTQAGPEALPEAEEPNIPSVGETADSTGKLAAVVTTVRSLYPVSGARVTVFEGSVDNMRVLATDFTDLSGRSKEIVLAAPPKVLSQQAGSTVPPYTLYNMMVESDGYLTNIHLNIPVFTDTVSLQRSNLMLAETAGEDKGPRIFDELQQFNL